MRRSRVRFQALPIWEINFLIWLRSEIVRRNEFNYLVLIVEGIPFRVFEREKERELFETIIIVVVV